MKISTKLSKNKPRSFFYKKIKFSVGLIIILITALISTYIVWERHGRDWYSLSSLSPEETAETLITIKENTVTDDQELLQTPKARLNMGKYKGTPNINKNFDKYDKIIKEVAIIFKVDCTLIKAQMLAESHGNAKATSNRGAKGLMQLMPRTARAMGITGNLYDPKTSLTAGAKYFNHLTKTACYEKRSNSVCDTARDYKYIFAAYNGGSKANDTGLGRCATIAAWECVDYEAYFETRVYVNRVKANYDLLMDNDWGC